MGKFGMRKFGVRKFTTLAALALGAIGLSACAELQQAETFINSPQTQQAIATLKSGTTAFICAVANASALALAIEQQPGLAGQSTIGTDGKVYVTSAAVCTALGGTVAGQGAIP
jgi:hypothetical protein